MSRTKTTGRADSDSDSGTSVCIFPTDIGWMGIAGRIGIVQSVLVGHPSAISVGQAVRSLLNEGGSHQASFREEDWHPRLRETLTEYALGRRVDFEEFDLSLPPRTPFRDKVLAATRQLGYGMTTTYGELARHVGHPGAARAVGTVMSSNRFPILIPCHRVLAAGGRLGGYTSPAGPDLKQRLLEMEQSSRGEPAACPASCFN
jgi:methylated-DNA-[protein]-cysteine S-methyltransferase